MKYGKLFSSLLLISALALMSFACAGGPDKTEPAEQEAKPRVGEKEEEKEKEAQYKEVEEEIQLVKKKSFYFPDGVLDQYRDYTYKETGMDPLQEVLYNSEDKVEEKVEYAYEDGRSVSKTTYNSQGKVVSVHKYSYDGAGNLVEDALYNSDNELQSVSRYEYDDKGQKVKWSVLDSSKSLLAYTRYIHEDGKNTKMENYSPGDNLEDYFVMEYNDKGQRIKETWYEKSGEVKEYREYLYKNGNMVTELVKRGNDSVKRKIEYSNNEKGNPVKMVYKDGGGDVQERVRFEYISRTRTRRVKID